MHPLDFLAQESRPTIMQLLVVAVLVLAGIMWLVGRNLQQKSQYGIVDFELAGRPTEARAILRAWRRPGQKAARRSLWVDFGFLVAYSLAISLACLYLAEVADQRGWHAVWVAGVVLAWAALLAGLVDAAENVVLLAELPTKDDRDRVSRAKAKSARQLALWKFGLVALCLGYVSLVRALAWLL